MWRQSSRLLAGSMAAAASSWSLCSKMKSAPKEPQQVPPPTRPLVVVVTGVTSGLGNALAHEFRALGHTVVGCGRREERIKDMASEFGPPHTFCVCDVTDESSVAAFANRVGQCDVVIANAGTFSHAKTACAVWECDSEEWRNIIDVNVNGVYHVTRHFGPKLIAQAEAENGVGPLKRLINISSGAGHCTVPWQSAYTASKWAVEALSKATAQAM